MQRERSGFPSDFVSAAADDGPIVRVHLALGSTLWRLGPAWSVLAGAFVFGWTPADRAAILRLVAAVALGDLAWGSLRHIVPDRPARVSLPDDVPAILPYSLPGAPLARLLAQLAAGTGLPAASAWQPLAASLVLIAALGLLLGPVALALSAGVLALVVLAWLLVVNRGIHPAFGFASLDIALPWLLGMSVAGWGTRGGADWVRALAPLAAFALLQWGVQRASRPGAMGAAGIWLGQAAVLISLIVAGQPWACAVVAGIFAPPSWWAVRGSADGLARALPWWWAALSVTVLALTQATHAL